jgi:F-type H+-transporting ATPase subunit b
MFDNIHFWLLIAFCIFIIIFYKHIKNAANNFLGSKIDSIKSEIQQADELLSSSMSLLYDKKKEAKELENLAEESIFKAQTNADTHYEKLSNNLNIQLKNSKEYFINYLKNEEQKVLSQNNQIVLDKAINNTVYILEKTINQEQHKHLIDESINNIDKFLQK